MTFEGVYSVLPTPFTDHGDLDEASLRKVVDLFIDKGANGLTALGVTGEVARLEDAERSRVLEVVVAQAAGRVPVVAGTTAEGTRTCVAYSRQAKAIGAAAVMVSPPRMAKLNSEAVVRHYKTLAEDRGHADRRPGLSTDFGVCDGASAPRPHRARDSAGADDQARRSTNPVQDRADPGAGLRVTVQIFGGLGGVFLLEELMSGATGAMTGFAFPEILVRIVQAYRSGQIDHAADLFYRTVPLMRFEFQEGIGMAIRKTVLQRRGALASAATRAPAGGLDTATTQALDRVLQWVTSQKGLEWICV